MDPFENLIIMYKHRIRWFCGVSAILFGPKLSNEFLLQLTYLIG